MGSESLFVRCKTCGKDVAKNAKACPHCGHRLKKFSALKVVGIVAGGLVALIVIAGLTHTPKSESSAAKQGNAQSAATQAPAPKAKQAMPAEEAKFIEIVTKHMKDFKKASNELQESLVRDERKTALAQSGISHSISDWIGTINDLETTTEGDAILSIRVASGVEIKTWNNALSDIESNSLIKKGSNLYSQLVKMSTGQKVKFSGSFYRSGQDHFEETSMTIDGSMTSPEFLFRFDTVEKL